MANDGINNRGNYMGGSTMLEKDAINTPSPKSRSIRKNEVRKEKTKENSFAVIDPGRCGKVDDLKVLTARMGVCLHSLSSKLLKPLLQVINQVMVIEGKRK